MRTTRTMSPHRGYYIVTVQNIKSYSNHKFAKMCVSANDNDAIIRFFGIPVLVLQKTEATINANSVKLTIPRPSFAATCLRYAFTLTTVLPTFYLSGYFVFTDRKTTPRFKFVIHA